jgi:predicted dehydrogenase
MLVNGAAMQGTLRAAVVGAGAFGRHHATKYAALPGVDLVAVADLDPNVRHNFQTSQGIAAVADWRELLGKVDCVSVCSPAVTHSEIVRAFLEAGSHVLVEKPIATDLDEADALITLAEAKNLVLTVGHQERFVFAHTGLLDYDGAPREIDCWRLGPWTGRGADVSVVLDLMIHDLDLVHRLVPAHVQDVESRARAVHGHHADEVSATLNFENGTLARLHTSRVSGARSRGMRLVYDDGSVEFDFLTRKIRNTTPRPLSALDFEDPLGASVASFVHAARSGETAFVRPEEARTALQTALLIDEAADRVADIRMHGGHEVQAAAR